MIVVEMKSLKLDNNWRILFSLVAVAVLLYILWYFRVIITYVLIAVVVSLLGDPLMRLLKKVRIKGRFMPAWLRATITLVSFFVIIIGFGFLFVPIISKEVEIVSSIDTTALTERLKMEWTAISQTVQSSNANINTDEIWKGVQDYLSGILSFSWIGNIVGAVSNFVIGFASVVFMSFFFLKDGHLFTRIVFTLTPDLHIEKIKNIMEHTHGLLSRYFIGLCIQSLVMLTLVTLSLWIMGVENALLIGVFAGFINIVPYVGPILGGAFGLIVAITTGLHGDPNLDVWMLSLKLISVFVVAQQIDGFIVTPLVLGNSVNAHPLEVFIVVLGAGTLGGITGMILALPVYTIFRVVAREFLSEFKWVESLTRELKEDSKE
jgi:predicted PurR-regulated permease PerM